MRVGVVAIGRNEGERLIRCLESLRTADCTVVYVDSGSTDGSVAAARDRGIDVVELSADRPFTAARGRNAGFAHLRARFPEIAFVQFVDGDCEVRAGWLEAAASCLDAEPQVAAVTGRRRERFPDASPYNRLADLEWDTPVGEATGFGGDVMVRAEVFSAVSGYRESLIAGEDPDLAFRILESGHRVIRLDAEMTLHDADMHRFEQFWRRQLRGGHAWAELLSLHGSEADPPAAKAVRSIVLWGLALPIAGVLLALPSSGTSLALPLLYAAQWWRIRRRERRDPERAPFAGLYAAGCVVGKFAETSGALLFAWTRLVRGQDSTLIEYKQSAG